ncbi:hypothetical protein [Aquisphaera insulae]|uniref:hypothetical protein n=1 Tax=Aquisphaera insulae TaxID=2712864 RepID=UPI0013ECE4F6|nr:hypothetical protein [Aquisphaera insulae]
MRRVFVDARSIHAGLLLGLAGCGGPRRATVHPVAGTLTVRDRPAAHVMVAYHPLGRVAVGESLPVGCTGPDGRYRLMTYAAGDGAPAGDYAVTVVWPEDSPPGDECPGETTHDRFEGRYADPASSPWRVTVGPGTNEVPLRLDAPAGMVATTPSPETPGE